MTDGDNGIINKLNSLTMREHRTEASWAGPILSRKYLDVTKNPDSLFNPPSEKFYLVIRFWQRFP